MTPVGMMTLAMFLDAMSLDSAGSARAANRPPVDAAPPAEGGETRRAAAPATAPAVRAAAALLIPTQSEPAGAAIQPTLSGLAQLISRIAIGASEAAPLPAAVLPAPSAAADALPDAIRNAVQASGLFYESHLEDWVAGRRTLEQLRMEPQGGVPVRAAPASIPGEVDTATQRTQQAGLAGQAGWNLPAVLEPVIREQLAALAQGSASVPIVPWPGQQALLIVHEDPQQQPQAHDDADAAGAEAGGRLGLKLTLPLLGTVTFVVSAQGDRIRVDARAEAPSSRDALAASAKELRESLAARALELEALQVESGAP